MNGEIGGSMGLSILSSHLIEGSAVPGDFGVFYPDHIMGHDVTAPPALDMLDKAGIPYLRAAKKTTLYLDHFTPPKDAESAEVCRAMIEFMERYGAHRIVSWGEGICHVHMFEEGRVKAGELVIGADSHITTGGAIGAYCMACGSTDLAVVMASGEFWLQVPEPMGVVLDGIPDVWCEGKDLALKLLSHLGPSGGNGKLLEIGGRIVKWLGSDGRFTLANMASESSCATAIIEQGPESGPRSKDWRWETEHIDMSDMGPQIALPGSPDLVDDVTNHLGKRIDQVFVGSCTNGRLDDLRALSEILRGRKVHADVRLLVIPGSRHVYAAAVRSGYVKNIIDAGGIVSMPTCGPCAGGFLGVLPAGEVALSTTNRNFRGRMGDQTSKVYLSGVAVAGASAVTGVISHPSEVVG
jgi:3-isopropylmalate/(R)-2-methylmalate dehydratase large subunit